MFKRIMAILIGSSIMLSLCACGKQEQQETEKTDESIASYYQLDMYYDYKTNHYKFRLPDFWKGKYNVVVSKHREDFYEINSYEKDESGLLFSILEYEDDSYKKELEGKDYTHLCYDERFELNYVLLMPDEETVPEEYREQYDELKKGIEVVKATFKAEL